VGERVGHWVTGIVQLTWISSPLFVSEQILLDTVSEAVKIHCTFGTKWLYNQNVSGAVLTSVTSARDKTR